MEAAQISFKKNRQTIDKLCVEIDSHFQTEQSLQKSLKQSPKKLEIESVKQTYFKLE
jgi:uncharacterized membrane-anchored protein YhcB (DUF1043 family)